MDKLLLNPAEVADLFGISKSKLYQLLSHGELESILIGRCRRVPVEAVKAYLDRLKDEAA